MKKTVEEFNQELKEMEEKNPLLKLFGLHTDRMDFLQQQINEIEKAIEQIKKAKALVRER